MGRSLAALLVSLLIVGAARADVAAVDPYRDQLLARAHQKKLAADPGWLRLGHWRKGVFGGWKSEADGDAFFRAPNGKTNPGAELDATLEALFDPSTHEDELDDAACRFPARLAFLARKLDIDLARLPPRACPRRDDFLARVRPEGVTLVFSSYYLNNPSSAFGHTFLRLDKAPEALGGKGAELLDHGVDYAATVDTGNALLYAVKGLLGFFKGEFKHYAYYYKVRQYADYESRDLWEYDLALEPAEVELLAKHLWELGGTWFDYWYLDENCSYHVLTALEAAAPRLDLSSRVGHVVVPSETVQALFRNQGLVRGVQYRPSIRTQFDARARALSKVELDQALLLARDPAASFPEGLGEARKVAVLDAAADLVDLRNARRLDDREVALTRQTLLERRARIPVQSPPLEVPSPARRRPDVGHGAFRMGVGGGAARHDGGFLAYDFRLALHDLGDPPDGYPPFASIEFLPTRLRFYPSRSHVELDDVSLVKVVSLVPLSRHDLRPSWRMRAGATTVRDAACERCLVGVAELGGGFAATDLLGAIDVAAFGDAALEGAPGLDGIDGAGVRLGLGPAALVRYRVGRVATLLAEARWRWLPLAMPASTWSVSSALRFHLTKELSLGVEARLTPADDELLGALHGYF